MILSKTSSDVAPESQPVSFQVLSIGNPEPTANDVVWHFNNETISMDAPGPFTLFLHSGSTLIISSGGFWDMQHEGTFRVDVTTSAGTGTSTFFLDVKSKCLSTHDTFTHLLPREEAAKSFCTIAKRIFILYLASPLSVKMRAKLNLELNIELLHVTCVISLEFDWPI